MLNKSDTSVYVDVEKLDITLLSPQNMIKSIAAIITVISIFLSPSCFASESRPTFEKYPIQILSEEKLPTLNLNSHPRARKFRTMLKEGIELGPNFSDHYTIVTWGCGTACQELAIVNIINGNVFFPPEVRLIEYHQVHDDKNSLDPILFRRDSNLLIIKGLPNVKTDKLGIYYYLWENENLKQIMFQEPTWL